MQQDGSPRSRARNAALVVLGAVVAVLLVVLVVHATTVDATARREAAGYVPPSPIASASATPRTSTTPALVAPARVVPTRGRDQVTAYLIGDSYSAGAGATTRAKGYVGLLQHDLHWIIETTSLSGGGYVDPGTNGSGPFSRLVDQDRLARLRPDVVLLQGGLNDKGLDAAAVRSGVRTTISRIRAVLPDVPIVVVGLLHPSGSGPDYVQRTRQDIASAATGPGVYYEHTSRLGYPTVADGVHPDDAGHRRIARAIEAELKAVRLI